MAKVGKHLRAAKNQLLGFGASGNPGSATSSTDYALRGSLHERVIEVLINETGDIDWGIVNKEAEKY